MDKSIKLVPERVSAAFKNLVTRTLGGAMLLVALWMGISLFWHNPYLDGFGTASHFGEMGLMGNLIAFMRFGIGGVPTLFLILCVARYGMSLMFNQSGGRTPEYNLLRGFIAVCAGAAGFGMIAPGGGLGGMLGVIAAYDISFLVGSTICMILGGMVLVVFFMMAATLLRVRWTHVVLMAHAVMHVVRTILSAFHLIKYDDVSIDEVGDDTEEIEEESDAEEEEEVSEEPAPRRGLFRRRDTVAVAPKSAPAPATAAPRAPRRRRTSRAVAQYELPDPKLLERSNFGKNVVTPELKRNAAAMEVRFAEYGVHGRVVGIRPGPIVTLYEFLPDNGTRINDVIGTVKDMTRAMATENIRIAHIPGTQYIGVEMVNLNRQTVRYQSLMDNPSFVNSKYRIPLALGVDIGGNSMYYDLAKMPHMLIAGRTGSGKSVFVQSIITSVVYHFTPDKCKLMIIDPKGVDFTMWDDIPHLITPIIKMDAVAAVNGLKWSVNEMENRYKRLQTMGAQNIESYNEIVAKKRAAGEVVTRQVAVGTDPETGALEFETQEVDLSDMPYLVIIIDEVADLMSVARKEVELGVQRLAQKARAAGIHLVMATQRPDATTITGVIKANFPTRISFQARSAIDSRTTLGEGGAENLLACGDMLFSEAGRVPVRIHGAFIQDSELVRVADFLRSQGEPEYTPGITDGPDEGGADMPIPGAAPAKGDKDGDLYTQAKEYVLRDKKPTISYIQRRLGIGYNKAAGFMERMEQEGIVSAPDANNKRQIL